MDEQRFLIAVSRESKKMIKFFSKETRKAFDHSCKIKKLVLISLSRVHCEIF